MYPLILIDVTVQILLFSYAMAYQMLLYLVYVCLYVLCIMIGRYDKLEKTGEEPLTKHEIRSYKKKQRLFIKGLKLDRSKKKKKPKIVNHDDSGYNTERDD